MHAALSSVLHRGMRTSSTNTSVDSARDDSASSSSATLSEGEEVEGATKKKKSLVPDGSDLRRLWGLTSPAEHRDIYAAIGLLTVSTGVTGCVPYA